MPNIQVFIAVNNKTLCTFIDINSQVSSIYDIIQSKIDHDVSRTHNLYFSGQSMNPNNKLSEYKIISESQIKALYSLGKDLSSRPPDFEGITAHKKLIKYFEKTTTPNDFYIFSLMSYNVCNINDDKFQYEGTINKNIYQQLQPDAIVNILNDPKTNDLETINLHIILSDSGFISFNKNFINKLNNPEYIPVKHSVQIDEIFGLIPYNSCLKIVSGQNKFLNRVIKFYCPTNSKEAIMKYFKIENEMIKNKIKFTFYYVGIQYPDSNIKVSKNYAKIYGINYTKIMTNSYVNMWTGEFFIKKLKNNNSKNAHNINYLSCYNPNIKIV